MKKILLASAFGLFFASAGFAQNGNGYWARLDKSHPETTVETIVNAEPAAPTVEGYRMSMLYDGQFRKLTPESLELMQTANLEKSDLKDYKYELLFKYNNQEFWMPVKTDIIEQLQLEVRQNEPVLLYTLVLQNPAEQDKSKRTVLVQDFKLNN